MNFFLIIDTRADEGILILANKAIIISKSASSKISRSIVGEINRFLTSNNLTFNDLSFIVINKGPGSFTALRAGLTVGKMISYTRNIPLLSYYAYECYVLSEQPSLLLFDGKSRGIYVYRGKKRSLKSPEEVSSYKVKMYSPDVSLLKSRLLKARQEELSYCEPNFEHLCASLHNTFYIKHLRKTKRVELLY